MAELNKPIVESGRSCGACSMCCKSFDVQEISKLAGKMCRHCDPGKGCRVWVDRPKTCKDFFCLWITERGYPDTWRPDLTKFIMKYSADGQFLTITLDRQYKDHWKREPYYSHFKRLSADLLERNTYILVGDGTNHILILPDSDALIGPQHINTLFHVVISKIHGKTRYELVIDK